MSVLPLGPWHRTGDPDCPRCLGEGWVCENHPTRPADGFTGADDCDCGASGMPCVCLYHGDLEAFARDNPGRADR